MSADNLRARLIEAIGGNPDARQEALIERIVETAEKLEPTLPPPRLLVLDHRDGDAETMRQGVKLCGVECEFPVEKVTDLAQPRLQRGPGRAGANVQLLDLTAEGEALAFAVYRLNVEARKIGLRISRVQFIDAEPRS